MLFCESPITIKTDILSETSNIQKYYARFQLLLICFNDGGSWKVIKGRETTFKIFFSFNHLLHTFNFRISSYSIKSTTSTQLKSIFEAVKCISPTFHVHLHFSFLEIKKGLCKKKIFWLVARKCHAILSLASLCICIIWRLTTQKGLSYFSLCEIWVRESAKSGFLHSFLFASPFQKKKSCEKDEYKK